METEKLIKSTVESLVAIIFGQPVKIVVQRNPEENNDFLVYITASDKDLLSTLIGRGGGTMSAIKHLLRIWEFRNKVTLRLWVESIPQKID